MYHVNILTWEYWIRKYAPFFQSCQIWGLLCPFTSGLLTPVAWLPPIPGVTAIVAPVESGWEMSPWSLVFLNKWETCLLFNVVSEYDCFGLSLSRLDNVNVSGKQGWVRTPPVLAYPPYSKTKMPSNAYFWWCHRCLLGDEAEATETKQPVAQDTAKARGYCQSPAKWAKITSGRIMSVWCQSVLSWQQLSFLKWQLPYNFCYINHFHNGRC